MFIQCQLHIIVLSDRDICVQVIGTHSLIRRGWTNNNASYAGSVYQFFPIKTIFAKL